MEEQKKKTGAVLDHPQMRRMYLPRADFIDLKDKHIEIAEYYWNQGKDIVSIDSYNKVIVPEAFVYGTDHEKILEELIGCRVEYNLKELHGDNPEFLNKINTKIEDLKGKIVDIAEKEQKRRVECIKEYLMNENQNKYISLEKIIGE